VLSFNEIIPDNIVAGVAPWLFFLNFSDLSGLPFEFLVNAE